MVERSLRMRDVWGSIPYASIIPAFFYPPLNFKLCYYSHSSIQTSILSLLVSFSLVSLILFAQTGKIEPYVSILSSHWLRPQSLSHGIRANPIRDLHDASTPQRFVSTLQSLIPMLRDTEKNFSPSLSIPTPIPMLEVLDEIDFRMNTFDYTTLTKVVYALTSLGLESSAGSRQEAQAVGGLLDRIVDDAFTQASRALNANAAGTERYPVCFFPSIFPSFIPSLLCAY